MTGTLKSYSIVAMLFRITVPIFARLYGCDFIYGSKCIMQDIELSDWNYLIECRTERIDEVKFTLSNPTEISSTITMQSDRYCTQPSMIDISGNHLRFLHKFHFTLDHLLKANLSRNEFENLDSDSIFEAHPQLYTIDLSYNRITSISSGAFSGLSDLNELFLNDNQLKEINEFMFAPLVQLRCLDLTANYIEKFANYPFGALMDLRELYLEKNNFSEFNFNILEPNKNLLEIALGDNYGDGFLSLIGNISFAIRMRLSKIYQSNITVPGWYVTLKNSKLSILVISNKVKNIVATNSSISKLIFNDNEAKIKMGDFSRNLLTGTLTLANCKQLEILDLSFNQIENILFTNWSLMTNLNLSHNNLTFIQNMTTLSKLKILDLSFNCIENFELGTFSSMISLEVLNLRQTCFKSMDYGTFSFQTELRVLDISFNNLNQIDLDSLSTQTRLEDLLIDGNNITTIQSVDLIRNYLPNLQSIGLTHNKWSCKTLSSLMNRLNLLNIKVFVESSVKHSTNIKGIGCTTMNSSSQETLIVPKRPMVINHTLYMNKIEQINGIVKTVNELKDNQSYREILDNAIKDLQNDKAIMKSNLDDRIHQFKIFGAKTVNKFELLNEINFKELMQMKATIEKLNKTNNEKYFLISESIKSLKDKLQLIQLNEENFPENINKIARDEIKVNSDYYEYLSTFKTLEICLIVLIFILFIVALYYFLMYC